MKKYTSKIFRSFKIALIFISAVYSGSLSLEVEFLETGYFRLVDFDSEEIDLWLVTVSNNTEDPIEYRLWFEFLHEDEMVFRGITKSIYSISPDQADTTFRNSAFQHADLTASAYEKDELFEEAVKSSGYLPQGTYIVRVRACKAYDYNGNIDDGCGTYYTQAEDGMTQDIENTINLIYPEDGSDVPVLDFFNWYSPGFREDLNIEYQLVIAYYNPEELDDTQDILEEDWHINWVYSNGNLLPFIEEDGDTPQTISHALIPIYYFNNNEFVCGYQYIWQVRAGDQVDPGIWGDLDGEYQKSNIYSFIYGQRSPEGLMGDIEFNDVLPTFEWESFI